MIQFLTNWYNCWLTCSFSCVVGLCGIVQAYNVSGSMLSSSIIDGKLSSISFTFLSSSTNLLLLLQQVFFVLVACFPGWLFCWQMKTVKSVVDDQHCESFHFFGYQYGWYVYFSVQSLLYGNIILCNLVAWSIRTQKCDSNVLFRS